MWQKPAAKIQMIEDVSEIEIFQEERIELWTIIANAAFKRALNRSFKKQNINITFEMYLILHSLWEEDNQSIKSLADVLQIKPKKIRNICNDLIIAELITRHEYGKKEHFHITEKGTEMQKGLTELASKALEKAHENISDEEWETCLSVLKRVFLNLNSSALKSA